MPARSLFKMATARLVQHKDGIEDIGEIPYDTLKGVLIKLDRPEQLHLIETNSPHILGQTSEIWLGFLRRDILNYEDHPVRPEDGISWYETYCHLKQRALEEQKEQEKVLMAQFKDIQEERDRNLATVSDKTVIPGGARKKAQPTSWSRSRNSAYLNLTAGSRTKTDTGSGIMRKVRREAAVHAVRTAALAPTTPRPKPAASAASSRAIEHSRQAPHSPPSRAPHSPPSYAPSKPATSIEPSNSGMARPYRLPVRSANPSLANPSLAFPRKRLSPPQSPSSATPGNVPPLNLTQPTTSSGPQSPRASPPKHPKATGVFMPAAKRRRE